MTENTGEYELLGYRVKFKPKVSDHIDPSRAVNLVLDEVTKIKSNSEVHTSEAILLAALKFALDKVLLEKGMKENMGQLQSSAVDALHLIEKAISSPASAQQT